MQTGFMVLFTLIVFAIGLFVGHIMTGAVVVDEEYEEGGLSQSHLDTINKNFANLAQEVVALKNVTERHTESIAYLNNDIESLLLNMEQVGDTTEFDNIEE